MKHLCIALTIVIVAGTAVTMLVITVSPFFWFLVIPNFVLAAHMGKWAARKDLGL